jgi:hypothetical protein
VLIVHRDIGVRTLTVFTLKVALNAIKAKPNTPLDKPVATIASPVNTPTTLD